MNSPVWLILSFSFCIRLRECNNSPSDFFLLPSWIAFTCLRAARTLAICLASSLQEVKNLCRDDFSSGGLLEWLGWRHRMTPSPATPEVGLLRPVPKVSRMASLISTCVVYLTRFSIPKSLENLSELWTGSSAQVCCFSLPKSLNLSGKKRV